jgi:2-polyprenyl-6-methoxyphenol hydroxylase-like FAD-dependent oxidoreductase
MARIIYEATKDMENIKYVFDNMITGIQEQGNGKVEVTFAKNHLPTSSYDVVIGADGLSSRTRRLVFGPDENYLYRLGQYSALFTMPRDATVDTKYAQWYNASRGRLFLLRPDQYGTTRAYLAVTDSNLSRFDEIDGLLRKGGKEEQQAWFEKEFKDTGYQAERCIREMKAADDFYMQQIAQVKMESWVKGHVTLVGDAAYCPTPISGVVGTIPHHTMMCNQLTNTGHRRSNSRLLRTRWGNLKEPTRYIHSAGRVRKSSTPIRR